MMRVRAFKPVQLVVVVIKVVQEIDWSFGVTGSQRITFLPDIRVTGQEIEPIGELEVCPEPEPNPKTTSTSASAEPSATASPKGVKTQITQAAAFGTVKDALTFLQELNAQR